MKSLIGLVYCADNIMYKLSETAKAVNSEMAEYENMIVEKHVKKRARDARLKFKSALIEYKNKMNSLV